jgi:hypothetical protein
MTLRHGQRLRGDELFATMIEKRPTLQTDAFDARLRCLEAARSERQKANP